MPKGAQTCCEVLQLIFFGAKPAWLGQDDFWIGLHHDDPSKGDQTTCELSYFGYQRQRIGKDDFLFEDTTISNRDFVVFPVNIGVATNPVRFVSIGLAFEGSGQVIYAGRSKLAKPVGQNKILRLHPGEIAVTEL